MRNHRIKGSAQRETHYPDAAVLNLDPYPRQTDQCNSPVGHHGIRPLRSRKKAVTTAFLIYPADQYIRYSVAIQEGLVPGQTPSETLPQPDRVSLRRNTPDQAAYIPGD